jgi:hypothetical protein
MQPIASLTHLLENPAWTAGATVIAVIGLSVSIFLARRYRSKKRLAYRISVTELVSVHGDAQDKIEISYEGETFERVHLVEVNLRNAGNVPITRSDFEVPVSVGLGEGSAVLSAEIADADPSELSPGLESLKEVRRSSTSSREDLVGEESTTKVKLEPALMNPSDRLTIKILVSDFAGDPDLDYRVVGVKTLIDDADPRAKTWKAKLNEYGFAWFVAIAFLALSFAIGFAIGKPDKSQSRVRLLGGKHRCGKILSSGPKQLVLREAPGGQVRKISIDRVISIDDERC